MTFELWLTFVLWETLELQGGQTDKQTHRHINIMTQPRLGARPSESEKEKKKRMYA